jgi:hypothetical protein
LLLDGEDEDIRLWEEAKRASVGDMRGGTMREVIVDDGNSDEIQEA